MEWSLATLPPIAVLGVLAVLCPLALFRLVRRTYAGLAIAALLSLTLLLVAGGIAFAWAYAIGGADLAAAFGTAPLATGLMFLGRGLSAALVWGPILALTLFGLTRRVEEARGEALKHRELHGNG